MGGVTNIRREHLSEMERLVLETLCMAGETNREIGARLFVTEQTVKFHITNAMHWCDYHDRTLQGKPIRNRTALALWWIREGRWPYLVEELESRQKVKTIVVDANGFPSAEQRENNIFTIRDFDDATNHFLHELAGQAVPSYLQHPLPVRDAEPKAYDVSKPEVSRVDAPILEDEDSEWEPLSS